MALSLKQADINGELSHAGRWGAGLEFHSATYLDNPNYTNSGQFFHSVLHPRLEYTRANGSAIEADIYLKKFNGTGADDPGEYSYGRPGIAYKANFELRDALRLTPELAIRLPVYSVRANDQDLDPNGFKKIWKFSLGQTLFWKANATHSWSLKAAMDYQTEKNVQTSYGNTLVQKPLLGNLSLRYQWIEAHWTIGAALRSEQTLNRGRSLLMDRGVSEANFVSLATNTVIVDAQYGFSPEVSAGLTITKSLSETGFQWDYLDTQFDDPIYCANFSAGVGISWRL